MTRVFAMPSAWTFNIKPVKDLISCYLVNPELDMVDPFVGRSPFKYHPNIVTNDINPAIEAHFNIDALKFLRNCGDEEFDIGFYDPPYSPRQVSEHYKALGLTVNMQTT